MSKEATALTAGELVYELCHYGATAAAEFVADLTTDENEFITAEVIAQMETRERA